MSDVERRKQAVVDEHGRWVAYNLSLGDGVMTMGPDLVGPAELNLRRIVQLVSDLAPRPLPDLRVLDLAAHEGLYGLELARQGAEVVAVEGRSAHVAKARFAAEVHGLDRYRVVQGDVREVASHGFEPFDVVLCLGILYHLPEEALVPFLADVAALTSHAAIVETQVSLAARRRFSVGGRTYAGKVYPEEPERHAGASLDNRTSFWLTRPSLLNALGDVGFTTVSEVLSPPVEPLAGFVDHVVLLATKGAPVTLHLTPQAPTEPWRRPEAVERKMHPTQSRWAGLADRLRLGRAGAIGSVFSKRR